MKNITLYFYFSSRKISLGISPCTSGNYGSIDGFLFSSLLFGLTIVSRNYISVGSTEAQDQN